MVANDFKTRVLPVGNKLIRLAVRMMENEAEAHDVVQDVFLKLWQKRSELDQINNIEAFAMRMTRNRCLDLLRSARTAPMDAETYRKINRESVDVHSKLELNESAGQIKMLMERLPELQRTVMHLRDVEQLSYEEIAEITQLKINALRVTLSRARKKVRDEFFKLNSNDGRKETIAATLF